MPAPGKAATPSLTGPPEALREAAASEQRQPHGDRHRLRQLGVSDDRDYLDHGMTGRHRRRPGLQQALAAVRRGDTLVVPKLAWSVPDARAIGDSLAAASASR